MTSEEKAAELAGWNLKDGPAPFEHDLPPEIDPDLGNNGIPPTTAERIW